MEKKPPFASPTAYLELSAKQAWELRLHGLASGDYGFVCKKCGEPVIPVEHPEHGDHFRHLEASDCMGTIRLEVEQERDQD